MAKHGRTVVRDLGLKETLARIRGLGGSVDVGVPQKTRKDGTEMVDVAVANEFGTDKIPARSFLRSTFDRELGTVQLMALSLAREVVDGVTNPQEAKRELGQYLRDRVKETIVDLDTPPNAPSTIARKGKDDPLRDTDQLLESITYRIRARKKAAG